MYNSHTAEVLFEDEHLLVIYKPAGLATQAAKVTMPDVVSQLKNHIGSDYLAVIHRLDQPVEGLLVFAKTKKAAADLTNQLSGAGLKKSYEAMVLSQKDINSLSQTTLIHEMYKDAKLSKAVIVDETKAKNTREKLQKAILTYQPVSQKEYRNAAGSLRYLIRMKIEIETGRFHQIRAQMAYAGFPLLGDRKYAGDEAMQLSNELGVRTVALCASDLSFIHPVSKEKMNFHIDPRNGIFN